MSTNVTMPEEKTAAHSSVEPATLKAPSTAVTAPEKTHDSSGPSTPLSYRNDNPFDTDVEAMITTDSLDKVHQTTTNGPMRKSSAQDCPSVWPSMEHWKQKAKITKRSRHSCNCMATMSKRNRTITKILIILLIVGIGLGVGFGVSKSLNAPIWGDNRNDNDN